MNLLKFNIESWWSLLRHLNNDVKLELASRLLESIKKPSPSSSPRDDWKKLAGAWNDEKESAEEMILLIKNSRFSNRQLESFD